METSTTSVFRQFDTTTGIIRLDKADDYEDTSMVRLPKMKGSTKVYSDLNDSMLNEIRERIKDL